MSRARSLAALALLLALGAAPLPAQVPVPRADSSASVAKPDSALARADTAAAAPVTAKRDSTVVITTRATPAKKGAKAPEPPYKIEADHMTGGRGPNGDLLFLDKVTITRSRTRLQSERGRYERATGMVYLEGNVRLRDSTANATCDEASFSEHEDRLDLRGNVVVTDRDATLKAPQGWYDRKNGVARLTGGVRGQEKKQRLVADEAFYQRDSMIVRARGNVIGNDDENKIQIEANAVDFDRRTKLATATGRPLMRATDDDGKETVLHARLLKVNSETKIAEAIDSVLVERDTLRASARYARFDDSTGRGILIGSPRAWDNETQVRGDTLETIAVKRKLERVIVRGDAVIDYAGARDTNKGESSRLTGTQVDMFVGESAIDSLVATGKAFNEYASAPKEGKTAERNVTKGDTIFVYFKDKKIDRARVQGGATGEYRPPVAVGDTTAERMERVSYDSRRIEFVIPKNKIVLDGDAHLSYRDLELHSRRVEFDSQKNTLVAEGKPQIVDKGDELNGQLMTYDMGRKVGTVYQATTEYERGLYHGKEIRKATDNELDVLGGAYSTCDLDQPHYHFSSHYMKIYLKDKMVAKPIVFYIRNVPILALPFWVFPIKPGRHSGFLFPQVEFGFNTTTGQFVRNGGYYWAPNDYFDVTAAGDYYQGTTNTPAGWAGRGELNYKLLYEFDGHMEGRFDRSTDVIGASHENYQFYGTHQQTLGERTRISAQGNFVSSRDYSKSAFAYGSSNYNSRLNRFLTSSLQLSHYAEWISLNAIVDRRQDLDADQTLVDPKGTGSPFPKVGDKATLPSLTVTYPSLSASLPTRALGSYQFMKDNALGKALASTYMTLSGRFLALETRTGVVTDVQHFLRADSTLDSSTVVGEAVNRRQGAASTFALSDSRRLFGWINFSPSLFGSAVVFDHDALGNKVVPAATWQTSAGLGTTLYRTMKTPFPGLAMRHVLTPTANIVYSPEFPGLTYVDSNGVRHQRFETFGDIGIFSGAKALRTNFSIDQRFQAKVGSGERVRRLDNLLTWTTSSSYDFLWRDNPNLKHGLGAIVSGVRLQPPGWVNGDATANIDAYNPRPLQSFSYNISSAFNSSGGGKPQAPRIATDPTPARGYYVESQEPDEFRETWSAALSYSYSGGYRVPGASKWTTNKTLNAVLRYQLTDNWTFDYQAGYDLTAHQMLLQRFNITRKIHCWEATFSRSFIPGGETEYFFHLGIREQKEVYYERGTRGQSFPGI